jgi:hypothetical protein
MVGSRSRRGPEQAYLEGFGALGALAVYDDLVTEEKLQHAR